LLSVVAIAMGATASHAVTPSEAIERAIENDSQLRQAELSLALAVLELESVQASRFLPSLGVTVDLPSLTEAGLADEVTASLTASLPLAWGDGTLTAGLGFSYNIATSALTAPIWQVSLSDVLDLANLDTAAMRIRTLRWSVEEAERSHQSALADLVIGTLKTYSTLLSEAKQAAWDGEAVARLTLELDHIRDLAAQGYRGDQDVNEARLLLLDAQVAAERSASAYATDLEAFCRVVLKTEEPCELSPIDLPVDDLLAVANTLRGSEILDSAVARASAVIAAAQGVTTAEEALHKARADLLPSVSIQAALDPDEWSLGVGVSLDLFEPNRSANIKIAGKNLELAREKLNSAREAVRNEILDLRASLLSAIRDAESLDLEREKWRLEEQVMSAKRAAGSLSDTDWTGFLEEKGAFEVDAAGRATALLVANLTYRNALGLELNWEEWL